MHEDTQKITELILKAAEKARKETGSEPEPELTREIEWPMECIIGPGLEGAIACESEIGYVNGAKGWLIYRGYDIFDLCANSSYEEVSYLLLHGKLPNEKELDTYRKQLIECCSIPATMRLLLHFPVEEMNPMSAFRLGVNLMRQEFTYADREDIIEGHTRIIGTDEDSIPMETKPMGEEEAKYEFKRRMEERKRRKKAGGLESPSGYMSCYHLLGGAATLAAAIVRIRKGDFPINADPELGYAENLLYMVNGKRPTAEEARLLDIALILHADHGMNASTFAAMVVASTLSDIYFSVGSGIAALNGPLHGGANEKVLDMLKEIGEEKKVAKWYSKARKEKRKVMGFGHRVYKAYDPRARILGPLVEEMSKTNEDIRPFLKVAKALEKEVVSTLGKSKGIFPNVDFYSGLLYHALGFPSDSFTTIFAVSRIAGWTSRVTEYLKHNRIFRPRAVYTGTFDQTYIPIEKR
jgi:citrate synthase